MEIITTETRRWGNSLGVVIPQQIVKKEKLKEHAQIRFLLITNNSNVLKSSFGVLKGKINKSGQEIKDQLRKELYDQ